MMRTKPWHVRWDLGSLLFGIGLVLISGPIGDWHDYVNQITGTISSLDGHKFDQSAGLDRFPGWLVLLAGWYSIAQDLGGARKPPRDMTARFARMRFRLRWLPVPILATLGTYGALAYHSAPPLIVTIDVVNAPPGVTMHGGPIVVSSAWYWSRYGATFDYLFGVPLPPRNVRPVFYNQSHSEFRFPAGHLSLQNWQPELVRVFLALEDERQRKSALVSVRVEDAVGVTGTIFVSHTSLGRCHSIEYGTDGACRIQVTRHSSDDHDIRVVFDLAGIELEPYGNAPYFNFDILWDPDP